MLRDKESAADYRYFPEPDIPPLELTEEYVTSITGNMNKLPSEMKAEYLSLGLTDAEAIVIVDQSEMKKRFDAVYAVTDDAKRASSVVLTQLTGFLTKHAKSVTEAPSPEALAELAQVMKDGTIATNAGKDVLEKMVMTGKSAQVIIDEDGLGQVSDDATLTTLIEEAIAANQGAIESFKKGKTQALGAIVGAVMKATKGQADAKKVNDVLMKILQET